MTDRRTDPSLQDLDRRLLRAAAILLAIASAAGTAGFALFGTAVMTATRRWYRRSDLPPRELANLKWQQTRAAFDAGAGAWRDVEKSSYTPRGARAAR